MDLLRLGNYGLLMIALLSTSKFSYGQISPGPLAEPHAHLEGMANCTRCHTLGGGPDARNCLACHKEIQFYLDRKSGYHFRVTAQEEQPCFACHGEHAGREFELIYWPKGKQGFDHALTGFELQGEHAALNCEACHQPENILHDPRTWHDRVKIEDTFLGLDQACLSCHRDEHRGQLGEQCLTCHTYDGWTPAPGFDHARARFRLTGQHRAVDCAKCHPHVEAESSEEEAPAADRFFTKFVGLDFQNCTACHEDVHQGRFGPDCTSCHITDGWHRIRQERFDHALTRFPLLGRHRDVACEKCHTSGRMSDPLAFQQCSDCHTDAHSGQFADRPYGGRCESCHDVFGFSPANFDIADHQESRFPLTGAHKAVPCVFCHIEAEADAAIQGRVFEFADLSCVGCHADVHKGQFAARVQSAGCEACHQTSAWEALLFDHASSRFSLIGKHADVACEKCHRPVDVGTEHERVLYRPMDTACRLCHADVHQGQFVENNGSATACSKCHTPVAWAELLFDHDRDASFKLTGAHEAVPCGDCHKPETRGQVTFIRYKPIDSRCASCHG